MYWLICFVTISLAGNLSYLTSRLLYQVVPKAFWSFFVLLSILVFAVFQSFDVGNTIDDHPIVILCVVVFLVFGTTVYARSRGNGEFLSSASITLLSVFFCLVALILPAIVDEAYSSASPLLNNKMVSNQEVKVLMFFASIGVSPLIMVVVKTLTSNAHHL